MKKWIAIAVILMCCLVYAIVKISMSEYQSMSENQNAYNQPEETQSAKQINGDKIDKATPEEDSVSPASAVQVEAVIKAVSEFKSALKSEDYKQAWKLSSEYIKRGGSFEEFKKEMAGERAQAQVANAIIHPESAVYIEGRVSLLVTSPEEELYLSFIQEDGQWKLHSWRPARRVDTSKE